jgi:ribosome-binding ATPase YchF (GTP1/OBG family)
MKLGIIGLPGSGKSTIFEALTQKAAAGPRGETWIGTVHVPDKRLDILNEMYGRKKKIYAQVEYLLPGTAGHTRPGGRDPQIWNLVKDCDALIHVIRNFKVYGFEDPTPREDFHKLDQELMLADLVVVEKRLERLELDRKRGKKIEVEELSLLNECLKKLENEVPLRRFPILHPPSI